MSETSPQMGKVGVGEWEEVEEERLTGSSGLLM
jgi:hypothetical protein